MLFTLLITAPPESAVAAKALDFAHAVLQQGHHINRLFFFADGTRNALLSSPLATSWQALMQTQQVPVTVCAGSADMAGVTSSNSLLPIAGMGDWLMATLDSDRLVTF